MKVKSIRKIGKSRVINLTVHKNHTFVTENGIVTHNCDHLSANSQAAFRGFLDEFGDNCKFIFTCNYKEKIIEPLLTRLQVIDYNSFDKKEVVKPIFERLSFILDNEGIKYEQKSLVSVINTYYPSIRSMIGSLQNFSTSGVFNPTEHDLDNLTAFDDIMELVSINTFTEMVSAVNKLNSPDNLYTFLYKNASKYFKPNVYPNVVLIIAKYQHMAGTVRDKNLNASACLTELIKIKG